MCNLIVENMGKTIWIIVIFAVLMPDLSFANEKTGSQIFRENNLVSQTPELATEWLNEGNIVSQNTKPDTATPVLVTGVRLNSTERGLEVILETPNGQKLQPVMSEAGTTLIANIPNAILVLSGNKEFHADNPSNDITSITVTQTAISTIRISIAGKDALPIASIKPESSGLVLSLVPNLDPEEEVTVTVLGDQQQGYQVPNASTATRTDTPIRDIPQSIQVIPQEIIRDQRVTTIRDAVRNVSGVIEGDTFGGNLDSFLIRGFSATILRNGFRGRSFGQFAAETTLNEVTNLERIEVLKGPASVLYGNAEPGGIINLVTKQPLREPYYAVDLQIGSFGFIKPSIDLSGPLTEDRSLRYRLNATYQSAAGFRQPFEQNSQRFFISPTLSWDISDRTNLTLDFAYLNDKRPFDQGIVAFGNSIANIPYSRNLGEPNDIFRVEQFSIGYRLEHRFDDNLKIRNAFTYLQARNFDYKVQPNDLDESTSLLPRDFDSNNDLSVNYGLQTDLNAKFNTGSIQHNLLVGFDLNRQTTNGTNRGLATGTAPAINIFNPIYLGKPPLSEFTTLNRDNYGKVDTLGIFFQDQIAIWDNLKLLIGGRFDLISLKNEDRLSNTVTTQDDSAFTPRVGLVYQPIPPVSLYASYGQSFNPNFARDANNNFLQPERGNQIEVGLKADLNPKLSLNLAGYWLTKTNIATTDPGNVNASIAIGEIQSQGIELDIAGEISPGWNVIASYANTNSKVTKSNDYPIGLRTALVPDNTFSLWTTYELQSGDLKGLGFGLGVYYFAERPGDFNNSYTLPSFLRTDATIFYKHNNWRFAINIKNLFNEKYIESVAYGRSRITPGDPFTIVGSLAIEF
jgi:iron complex outermembrane recepter protein